MDAARVEDVSKSMLMLTCVAAAVWIAWCFLVIDSIVPAILRHLTIYPDWTAWVLCILPAALAVVVILARLPEEG